MLGSVEAQCVLVRPAGVHSECAHERCQHPASEPDESTYGRAHNAGLRVVTEGDRPGSAADTWRSLVRSGCLLCSPRLETWV
jgi:hypothetical protein